MSALAPFIEPALQLDEYSTVHDALPSLALGQPVWLRRPTTWAALVPQNAVGHSDRRRIVDLPLVELAPVSMSAKPADLLSREPAGGYLPVVSEDQLVGHIAVARVERAVPLMRSDLAIAIAHDVNNSLTAVAAALAGGPPEIAEKALEHASRLVSRLQALAGRAVGDPKPVDVGALVTDLAEWLPLVIRPVQVEITVASGTPRALANQAGLERILVNLAMNARDALDGPGFVRLRVHSVDGSVAVDVEDTGPGIPPRLLARLFDAGETSNGLGRGIGLSSASDAARRMGGRLLLVRTDSTGTLFRLQLLAAKV